MSLFCRHLFGSDMQPTPILWAAQSCDIFCLGPYKLDNVELAVYECGGLTIGSESIHFISHTPPPGL
ncbi:hypothetical protein ACN42_g2969 [Penicillium freii]|uniref:Uncharacterized protein n=1 Tax=Penicillium freii TaxID=48697 RepID=A0A101MP52_PENFR|nr:hypothetical protein ACN42_g2969 [Penicillium freii]